MNNLDIAKILGNIAKILELKNEDRFKVLAYERVAEVIANLTKDLGDVYQSGGLKSLEDIPGVGPSIGEKIEEMLKTGHLKYYQQLTKEFPEKMLVLTEVPGIGAKTAQVLYTQLGIDSLSKLAKAAQLKKIQKLPHIKEQTEKNILRGIAQYNKRTKERERLVLTTAGPIAEELLAYLMKNKAVEKCDVVGSLRRMKETIGDLDIIVATDKAKEVITYFVQADFVKNVLAQGQTKVSITHQQNVRVDLEVLRLATYGSLLQHFTGSKEHNVALRTWAAERGLKISEYGIENLKQKKNYQFTDEKKFYNFLGMQYIAPELREDRGELQAALKKQLPEIIGYDQLLGDLHCHTENSDGSNTIWELVKKAQAKKYKYLGISDHTIGLGVASGLSEKALLKQRENIDKVNKKIKGLKILCGAEINIKADGKLDIGSSAIAKLDFAIGSVHSAFNQDKAVMTKRILNAVKSGINILGHPSGRLIGQRSAYEVDWEEIFKACAKYQVALEINSFPERLDLKDILIKDALAYGCKFCINSDAHDLEHLDLIKYGIATARRGWATSADVINSWSLASLLKWLKK